MVAMATRGRRERERRRGAKGLWPNVAGHARCKTQSRRPPQATLNRPGRYRHTVHDEIWTAFQQTAVHVERRNSTWRVTPAPIDVIGAYFPDEAGPFHILTAHNPQGIAASTAANTAAHARLAAHLAALDLAHVWPATGADAAGVWAEDGFMVAGLTRLEAVEIARLFDQRAIFEWANEPGGFRLIACDESTGEARGWVATINGPVPTNL